MHVSMSHKGQLSLLPSVGRVAFSLHASNEVSELSQWVTLTFDPACRWAFRWAKVRPKSRLKSKSKVISLSERLKLNYGLSTDLDRS